VGCVLSRCVICGDTEDDDAVDVWNVGLCAKPTCAREALLMLLAFKKLRGVKMIGRRA